MVDLNLIRDKYGLTQDNLKKWLFSDFSLTPMADASDPEAMKRSRLRNRIRSRITENLNRNFTEGKHYHALDVAWDTPFRQVTPTLLQSIMDKDLSSDEVNRIVSSWGLAHLIEEEHDPKSGQPTGKKKVNIPIFFNVFVPLVKAYVTIRWAKIVNDRRLTPFLKYEPAKSTAISRLRCEALTDRVQVMSIQYDYFSVMKQAVLKMLHYGFAMQFPREEWDTEQQRVIATELDVALGYEKDDGTKVVVGDEILKTIKEGMRFHHPHPARVIRDLNHPMYTYNSDSGCEYGGYWRIVRYRDLGKQYWNTDKISIGATDLIGDNAVFFTTVYPCAMAWPSTKNQDGGGGGIAINSPMVGGNTLAVEAGFGVGDLDREKGMANQFYTTDHDDQAVLVTEYFEKLIPSENGLGTYDCPIWMRFVVAGDQATILYAAPLPSCPITYAGYDEDANRKLNASMTLEIMPFQDQFGNLLTQMLLGVKNNLANLVMIDEDQVGEDAIEKIKNIGERFFRSLNVFGFSTKKQQRSQQRIQEAVQSFKFPQMNTVEIIGCMKVILDTMERVLVMSSQEVGQAASHEQTREEIINVKETSSSRQTFTAIPVDNMREAWKRQLYCYLMAYGEREFYAHIPSDVPIAPPLLLALGFTATTPDSEMRGPGDKHMHVHTSLDHLKMELWEFAGTKDGEDRQDEGKLAATLSSMLQELLANPITAQAIGADQALQFANQIAHWAGLPNDFAFHNAAPGASPQQAQEAAQQQLKQVVEAVMAQITPELAKAIKPMADDLATIHQNQQVTQNELAAAMRILGIAPEHPKGPDVHPGEPNYPNK